MAKIVLDIALALLMLVGAVYLWFVADGFPSFPRYREVDADFWPKGLMVLIGILALVLLAQSLQALRLHRAQIAPLDGPAPDRGATGWKRAVFAAALTVGYVVGLRYTGFLIATVVFLAIAQNIVAYANVWVKLLFPVAFTAVLAVLFVQVMGLSLPRGTGMFYQFSLLFY